ncbi:HAMP domain-containing sensor histidine kinase [Hydrogenoanaerobacterium sp.]|uniref:sensor histidine kinase n=1 Tax=Hydrogenoanaerobacterium sp. TaxID=2953763 RepID=UPI0028966E92|nr:HAMP domain-containing sensor histidine kinase [Hydrogenoanaerobacterium sp.]
MNLKKPYFSIRHKLTLTILIAFVANFGFLVVCYLFLVSDEMPKNFSQLQQTLHHVTYRNLLLAELLLIEVILMVVTFVIYLKVVRPIEALKKGMDDYHNGIKPKAVSRRDEIGQLQNRFVQLTCDIEREKQTQNRIIASISHDIKTPLTSVMGYAERLQKGGLSQEREKRYISTIYDKSVCIKDLIEEFDDYLSCNLQNTLKLQSVTVEELCHLVQADYRDELEQMKVRFTVNSNCSAQRLRVDIAKLRRVFGNIIGNSVKHFGVKERSIAVTCEPQQNAVMFCIADSGVGVAPEKLERIFEPLYTSDAGRSVAGLGLAICREIVHAHGGKIWAENNICGGLSIFFVLKLQSDR